MRVALLIVIALPLGACFENEPATERDGVPAVSTLDFVPEGHEDPSNREVPRGAAQADPPRGPDLDPRDIDRRPPAAAVEAADAPAAAPRGDDPAVAPPAAAPTPPSP